MDALFQKAKGSKPGKASHFVTETTLENWIPSWLGASRTPPVKKSLLTQWKKGLQGGQGPVAFLASTMTLWLSHASLGIITFQDVFLHLLLFLRVISEKDLLYAVKYERHLQVHIMNHIKSSGASSVASFLVKIQPEVAHDMDLDLNQRQVSASSKDLKTPPRRTRPSRSRTPTRPQRDKAKPSKTKESTSKKGICFFHDPASGKECKFASDPSKRPRDHLDTLQAPMKARFDAAKASYHPSGRFKPKAGE